MAIVNIQDVIAKRKAKNVEKTATVFVPSLDGEIKIKSPSDDDMREYDHALYYEFAPTQDNEIMKKATSKLILRNVVEPNLKDKDLIESMGCKKNPEGIVDAVFSVGEIMQIASFILKLGGKGDPKAVRLVDELKNE